MNFRDWALDLRFGHVGRLCSAVDALGRASESASEGVVRMHSFPIYPPIERVKKFGAPHK